MEKRYQVFVSSTYADLREERSLVIQTLMEMDCIPSGMELFPAADEEQWEFIKKVIDDCDYYILIIGGRYGSLTADGISYTEKEYDYAVSKDIRVTVLLHKSPNDIPAKNVDIDPKLREKLEVFRKRVSQGRLVKFWERANELPGMVALSLNKTIKTFPAVGWARANQVMAANETVNSDLVHRLFVAEEKAKNIETLFSRQLETTRHLTAKFRDYFFSDIRIPLMQIQENKEQEIAKISKTYVYHICYSLLTNTRKLFQEYYNAQGYFIGEDLSLAVKLIVTREEANLIQNQANDTQLDEFSTKGTFVATAFRDPYTWEHRIERREVKQIVYRAEENTAFDEVLNQGKRAFYSNNLRELYNEGRYSNEHHDWNNFYNSVLVLPIWYKPKYGMGEPLYYGVLCVDSRNPQGLDLFNEGIPYYMLAQTADMFAMMWGHIDTIQRLY